MTNKDRIDFQQQMFFNMLEQAKFADQKASILLAGLGILGTIFINDINWTGDITGKFVAVTLIIVFCGVLLFLLSAIYPRYDKLAKEFESRLLDRDALQKFDQEAYSKKIQSLQDEDLLKELSLQTILLAKIACRKFNRIKLAIYLLALFFLGLMIWNIYFLIY